MANNLSTKFVTSFSELYIREGRMTNGEEIAPATWFSATGTNVTAKQIIISVASDDFATVGRVQFVIQGAGLVSDAVVVETKATGTPSTATAFHTALGTAMVASPHVASATSDATSTTIVLEATAEDANVIFDEAFGIVATSTIAVPVAYSSGADTARIIPNVMEIGTLSNEATIIETPAFGDAFKGKLRGQLDGGQLDAQLYWAPRDSVHLAMREAATNGTPCSFGIKWKSDVSGTAEEYVVFNGFLSSFGIDTTFDDVAKASSTMIVDGQLYFASGA